MGIRMTNIATPMPQLRAKFTNKLGIPLSGCKVYTYEPSSNIPKKTWIDVDKTVENTNPILLDAAGEADIYLDGLYRIVVKDRFGFTVYDVEKTGSYAQFSASSIVDGNENQHEINRTTVRSVNTIADLLSLQNPKNDQVVNVKGYYEAANFALAQPYKGGGTRIYVSTRSSENDGFLCINGWVLQVDDAPNAYQAGAVGDGVYDDTDALQRLFNYSAPTTWQGGTTQSQSYFRNGPKVRVHKGCYRITRSLLVGTGADIEFENAGSFFFSKDDGAVVYADFSNPLDFVIKSANYDVNGVLCAYSKFVSGSELDASTYSNTHNIKIKNLQIIAKNQIYGGLKLTAAPQSIIENFYISNVDYGVAISSSWTSDLSGQTAHHKAGICAVATNHNLKFNGYFNRFNSTTLPLNTGVNLIPTDHLGTNSSCGVFLQGAQSAVSTQLTCEKNAIGLIAYYCPTTLGSFYSELNSEYTLYANASNVSVDTVSGYFDNRNFKIQNNSSVTVINYDAGSLTNFVPNIVEYADEKNRLSVFNGFHYFARNVIYQNYDKIIYVDPTLGNDLYTGFNKNYPCKSLNRAIEIASSVTSDGTMLYNKCTVVVNGGSHTINNANITNAELIVRSGATVASINFNTDSSFRLSNSTLEIINCVVNVDKSYGWASYGSSGLNVLILRDCIANLSNNACILYSNTNATNHLYLTSGAVNGGASECIAIIPNGSFATIEVKCSAEVSSAITSRADKGLNLNRDNAIKIFPISLR